MRNNIYVHAALTLAAILHALNYTIAKFVMSETIGPFGLIVIRVTIALCLFWATSMVLPSEKIDKKDFGRIVLSAVLGASVNILFFFKGLAWTTPANASLIMTTTPILVIIPALLLNTEKLNITKLVGLGFGLIGTLWLLSHQFQQINFNGLYGDLMVFGNALFYAAYLVVMKPLLKKYQPITLFKWLFLFGLVLVLPFGLDDIIHTSWTNTSLTGWLGLGFVAVCATFLTYLLNAWALKKVNPSLVGIYIYLQPLVATAISVSLGDDTLNWQKIGVACLIFTGVFLVSRTKA